MDWSYWFCCLYEEAERIGAKFPEWIELTGPGDLADQFLKMERATQSELASAISEFASTGHWPPLSQTAGAMLRTRLKQAAELATDLNFLTANLQLSSPRRKMEHRQWIEWFLQEQWDETGLKQIHGSLEDLRHPGAPHNGGHDTTHSAN